MKKINVIYGGMSTEHDISIKSSKYVINNLDRNKYIVKETYIDKDGNWYESQDGKKIENICEYLKENGTVFPVLHGLYGEDGTIQGMLDFLNIPYVGCKILSSSLCINKMYTKIMFDKCNIRNAKAIYIKYLSENNIHYYDNTLNTSKVSLKELDEIIKNRLEYPVFIKPACQGSSIGVSKVNNHEELYDAIKIAGNYDETILIEENIIGKEVEVAVLGDFKNGIEVSEVGEILSAEDFYTFTAKYENPDSRTVIPANLDDETRNKIRQLAKKAFIAVEGRGLSRIDFFVKKDSNEIILNEINTLPGLTNISMYPMLMRDKGYSDSEILDKLIEHC